MNKKFKVSFIVVGIVTALLVALGFAVKELDDFDDFEDLDCE